MNVLLPEPVTPMTAICTRDDLLAAIVVRCCWTSTNATTLCHWKPATNLLQLMMSVVTEGANTLAPQRVAWPWTK